MTTLSIADAALQALQAEYPAPLDKAELLEAVALIMGHEVNPQSLRLGSLGLAGHVRVSHIEKPVTRTEKVEVYYAVQQQAQE